MYCTTEDVRGALTPDADNLDDDTAAGLSEETLTDAIVRATAFIHTYIGKQYLTPVDVAQFDPDGILRDWTSVLAAWNATLTFSGGRPIESDDPLRLRHNAIVKTVERVQSGNLTLPWPTETLTGNDIAVVNRWDGRMFAPEDFNLGDSRRPYGWGVMPGWGP